jgi:hypothetical protein
VFRCNGSKNKRNWACLLRVPKIRYALSKKGVNWKDIFLLLYGRLKGANIRREREDK